MKQTLYWLSAFLTLSTAAFSQDYYTQSEREHWLRQAEKNKPVLASRIVQPTRLVRMEPDVQAFQGWKTVPAGEVTSFYSTSVKSQPAFILDFGEHLTGYVSFAVSPMQPTPDAPARLRLTFGEVPSELATPFDPYPGGLSRAWLQDELVTVMTVPDTITLPRRLSFRYVKVELVHAPSYDFAVSHIECRAITSASQTTPPLPSTVPALIREIDRVGLHTLKECMQTVYEDGPKRDQRLWIGDLYLEALANNYSYKQHDLTKRCLYILAGLADPNGLLNGTIFEKPYPHAQAKQILYDYALLYNVALKDYLDATGDRQTAEDLWKVARKQLDIARPYLQDNGLMDYGTASRNLWVFFDWRDGLHKEVAMQGLTIFAFEQTYELARLLGKEKEVADLPPLLKKMKAAARKRLYDKKSGLFRGTTDPQLSYASQVWMVLGGVATRAEAQRALKAVALAQDVVRPGTPYAYHYYIQALVNCGLKEEARTALTDYWGGMIRKGADTFWEAYDPDNDYLSPYNFFPMNSYCHAWSCTPVYFIRKYPDIFQQ